MAYSAPVPMLPHGYTFMPTDEELVIQYLRPRAMNKRVPCAIIVDVEIMRYNPWDLLPEGSQEKYFFTKKELKYKVGTRRNRVTSEGYWRATGTEIPIHSTISGQLIGMKRSLVFYRGHAPNGEHTEWAIQEFRLASAGLRPFPVMRPVGADNQGPHCLGTATAIANKEYGFVNCVQKKDDALAFSVVPANSHYALHPVMVRPDESWVICRVYKKRSRVHRGFVHAVNAWGYGAQYIDFMGEANRELSPAVSSTTDTVSSKEEESDSDSKNSGNDIVNANNN